MNYLNARRLLPQVEPLVRRMVAMGGCEPGEEGQLWVVWSPARQQFWLFDGAAAVPHDPAQVTVMRLQELRDTAHRNPTPEERQQVLRTQHKQGPGYRVPLFTREQCIVIASKLPKRQRDLIKRAVDFGNFVNDVPVRAKQLGCEGTGADSIALQELVRKRFLSRTNKSVHKQWQTCTRLRYCLSNSGREIALHLLGCGEYADAAPKHHSGWAHHDQRLVCAKCGNTQFPSQPRDAEFIRQMRCGRCGAPALTDAGPQSPESE